MRLLDRFQSEEGDYFHYRKSVKFICELLIAISAITAVSSIGTMIGLGIQLQKLNVEDEPLLLSDYDMPQRDVTFALFIFTILILIVSISDIIFVLILRSGINQLKISHCLFWRGAAITSLVVVGMLTLAFITMVRDLILILGYLPSLISKPFSLWIVNGFIRELGELRALPRGMLPPVKPSFSVDDLDTIKQSTTIFYNNRRSAIKYGNPYVIPKAMRSLPEYTE